MKSKVLLAFGIIFITMFISMNVTAQHQHQMVRMANIEVDPSKLTEYNKALKEQMNTAIKAEPGVLSYYAVADKANPSHITIIEIYADTAAYRSHTETAHFKKYKALVQDMVKSLQLTDLSVIAIAKKPGM